MVKMPGEEEWVGRYREAEEKWEKTKYKCRNCKKTGSVYRHITSAGDIDKLYCDKCGKYFLRTGRKFSYVSPEFKEGKVKGHEFVEIKEERGPAGPRGGSIHGFVRDRADGKPIVGAHVYVPIRKYVKKLRARTDKQGYYRIDNIPIGEFPLRAGAKGYFIDDKAMQRVRGQKLQICDFLLQPKSERGREEELKRETEKAVKETYEEERKGEVEGGGGEKVTGDFKERMRFAPRCRNPNCGQPLKFYLREDGKGVFICTNPNCKFYLKEIPVPKEFIEEGYRKTIKRELEELKRERGIEGRVADLSVEDRKEFLKEWTKRKHDIKKHYGGESDKEFEERKEEIEKKLKIRKRKQEAPWTRKAVGGIENKVGKLVMKGFILACFVGLGAVATVAIGLPIVFFLGFLGWGIYYLLPDPNDFKIPDEIKNLSEDNPLKWNMIIPFYGGKSTYVRNANMGWGVLRSVVKIGVFACFIIGVYTSAVPLGNIVLIILAFFGYYSLKITYDVEKPYELIESLLRFAGLGFYFIPWVIMYGIFDSMLLALIAMAFFAIPPIPKERKNSELFMMYDFYDKIIFAIIMGVVLVLFFSGWEVSKTLSATFIYFWFVTLIAGFFSPAEARPAMGFLMLGAATIIYGIGPGTQQVMSGLFGPWWPTIQNTFSSITEPIGEAFGGFANTLRSGWLMLTDPVGYATQLMNGTHAVNPIGKTGSLGVEITDITISAILPAQPFVIIAMLKNEGAFDAENVTVFLSTDYEGSEAPLSKGPSKWWGPLLLVKKAWERDILQFREMFGMDQPFDCWENVTPSEEKCENKLTRQNIWQLVFTSDSGVSCDVIEKYKLREKYIPVKVAVTYNYSVDSNVDVEFISKNEWQRLAEANQLSQKLRIIQSKYSTAPVEFPIGTPGLKNPILVGQAFHLGMRIEPSGVRGSIENIESVVLEYPSDFKLKQGGCTPGGRGPEKVDEDTNKITWEDLSGGSRVFYCPFEGLEPEELTGPTKTYVVKAGAEYTFTRWKEKDTRIEFGGKCCNKDDCLKGQECVDGMCVSEGAVAEGCDFEPNVKMEFKEITKYKTEILNAVRDNGLASYTDSIWAAEALVAAIIEKESSWNANTKTHEENVDDHSFGLMQIRFKTAEGLGFPFKETDTHDNYNCDPSKSDNLCYPARNIDYGAKYLAQQLKSSCGGKCTHSSLMCAISNYNAGSGCPLNTNKDNCRYVKNVLENYYKYYFYYDYCGWREKQNLGKCTLGMGGCTGDSQCDQYVTYGPDDGTKRAPICRTDTKPKVCCPPSDIFDKSKCDDAYSTWKSQG